MILRRLRGSGGGDYPIGAWVTTTPNRPGSALYNFFENPKTRDPNAKVYRMPLDDNKDNLPEGFIEGIKREHTGALYKRFVEGIFAVDEVATLPFDYAVHVAGYEQPPGADVEFGVDFGWVHNFAIAVVLFDGDRRAFVADEVYASQLSEEEMIAECHRMKDKWGEGTFWCDSSQPRTIDALKRSGIRAKPADKNREEGLTELGGRLKDAGDGRRRLYVSPACVNLIDELQTYSPQRKEHDDLVDSLRYCLIGAGKPKREPAWGFGKRGARWR